MSEKHTDTKKGVPLYSNLVNLKSNTMKNTVQRYGFITTSPNLYAKIIIILYYINIFTANFKLNL
ncbi:unknown [Prevotella sp. CAG:1185]|nr:unknown [Prevotella sp. CAG:1185]